MLFILILDINTKKGPAENIHTKTAVEIKDCESFKNKDTLKQLGELHLVNFMIAFL